MEEKEFENTDGVTENQDIRYRRKRILTSDGKWKRTSKAQELIQYCRSIKEGTPIIPSNKVKSILYDYYKERPIPEGYKAVIETHKELVDEIVKELNMDRFKDLFVKYCEYRLDNSLEPVKHTGAERYLSMLKRGNTTRIPDKYMKIIEKDREYYLKAANTPIPGKHRYIDKVNKKIEKKPIKLNSIELQDNKALTIEVPKPTLQDFINTLRDSGIHEIVLRF